MFSRHDIKLLLEQQGIRLSKRRGQNFLLEPNILVKLVKEAQLDETKDAVIEIGGGLGHLSRELAKMNVPVVVFEIDRKLACYLHQQFQDDANVKILHQDFLKYPISDFQLLTNKRIKVIANIPYCIASLILEQCMQARSQIHSMVWIVQKEFALRLTAQPSTKNYSALSAFAQLYFDMQCLFKVPRHVFFPVPDVDSVAVSFKPLDLNNKSMHSPELFRQIVKSIFSARRKTLYNSLVKSNFISIPFDLVKSVLETMDLSEKIRGEMLSPQQIRQLSNYLSKKKDEFQ